MIEINIAEALPHSPPFILPEKVIACDQERCIHTQKTLKEGDYFLNGHFASRPVFPGVMLIEAMAQSAGLLLYFLFKKRVMIYLAKVNNVRFKQIVEPPAVLDIKIELEKSRRAVWFFNGKVFVAEQEVASAEFALALGDQA